ncbi:MAG: acyltransferase domain-containing protein [Candidatus Poseidoniales archaeon]|nr:MAG: acyltransferase domain-containing protein [Candidatus Poseidoniales archaeon]
MTLTTADGKICEGIEQGLFEPIAIVGIGALMPDAEDVEAFWQNIIDAKVSIESVVEDRWPGKIEHFWKEGGPGNIDEGFTYSKIGAFVKNFEFDWRRWRQPPGTLAQIDPCQLWAVGISAAALENAGYDGVEKDIDRSKCGVVFANALGGENRNLSNIRVWSNHTKQLAKKYGLPEQNLESFQEEINEQSPRVDEDTMPGELANVVSGRVANLLDLQGPNYATDAACASSMAAVLDACRMLQSRQVDVMLAGATDRTLDPATYAKFSAIGALSATHSTPFDAKANGFVMGEGAGVLVLKRLNQAIEDGDTVHAVIRGIGGSSDGRGKGITAPSQRGQVQAIARAYNQAGYEASTVELVEAHGTSTKVGDATELSTLSRLWDGYDGGDHVAVGSIKSQIGHLKAAAGIAGIIKGALALHHRTIPPSAGFKTPNPTVEWSEIPFFVPTEARDWPKPSENPRRAGVSAFGFGGTNFHIALEGYESDYHIPLANHWESKWQLYSDSAPSEPSILDGSAKPSMTHEELKSIEGGMLLLSGQSISQVKKKLESLNFSGPSFDEDPRGRRLSLELDKASIFDSSNEVRMAIVATSWADFDKRVSLAVKAMDDKEKWGFLQSQGVLLTDEPALPAKAKIAHMYPGQGSQYVGMTFDLYKRYTSVQAVWEKSDETMVDVLDGETLSSFVLRSDLTKEELVESEHKLKQTEYTQPAMLTADLAIERLLNAHGHKPDMVAGHSLGEYAALMSAGILNMDGALRASAARGTEMGSVQIDDKGLMASITAPYQEVEAIIESIDGYVISANKNSPKMTVIAGQTEPVKQAMKIFESKGYSATALATSHAFHSRIVAPANEPLRRFLETLEISWPKIPITANVDGQFYDMKGDNSKDSVLSKLAPQMASSVEWTSQIETMYGAGARAFVEVGPKRALTMFATQILEGKPHLPIMTNHPKQGGIASFLTAIASLALAGRRPMWPEPTSQELSEAFRAGPIEAHSKSSKPTTIKSNSDDLKTRSRPLPSNGASPVISEVKAVSHEVSSVNVEVSNEDAINDYVGQLISSMTDYPAKFCSGMVDMRLVLGMSEQEISSAINKIRSECETDSEFEINNSQTIADLARWVRKPPQRFLTKTKSIHVESNSAPTGVVSNQEDRKKDPYVITGISLGLPGGEKVFCEDTFERLVRGETCISEVSDEYKQKLLDKNIVRLIKGRDGSVNMEQATQFGDIPQLAGLRGAFDLSEEFGIDPKSVLAWDIATQLAVASGLLALRDAGIPLTPVEQVGKGGLRLITNWQVPKIHRDRTGVIFSSCFPGIQSTLKHTKTNGDDGEGRFDRRYLFQVLNMGHSQFAQYTGIRGPNTTINVACASATAAFSVAEDWLSNDRVDRVVILSADDITGDDTWEWFGSGFASSGAASSSNVVEESALPFDKRRNGLILGMGAAAFVIERRSHALERGVQPIAELLGTKTANSAFHGTRLDIDHVAETFDQFIHEIETNWGLDRHVIAPQTVFFSHETYTPARGGSAQSEVKALRQTFGSSTDKIVIANTKGFTGHPMGVGIEDASMFYGLMTGRIPPIANHKEVDEELGNLNLSEGGDYPDLKYGMRFGAGFGSQIALSFVRKCEFEGERIDGSVFMQWIRELAKSEDIDLRILQNKLVAYVDGQNNLHGGVQGEEWHIDTNIKHSPAVKVEDNTVQEIEKEIPVEVKQPVPQPTVQAAASSTIDSSELSDVVIEVVVKHTGYPADFVELDQDLEGELGIDTVKQAEIMADIRSRFNLPVDEDFILSDYPTLNHMIGYIQKMTGDSPGPVEVAVAATAVVAEVAHVAVEAVAEVVQEATTPATPTVSDESLNDIVIEVVVEHTGYPADFIELDQDLEGELGIDTVKQAEIMADIRSRFNLPVDEDFILSDYPTLNHMIAYIQTMTGTGSEVKPVQTTENQEPQIVQEIEQPKPIVQEKAISTADTSEIETRLIEVVVKHTGYPADFIEMDQDLEGELGIDTVKQAEIMAEVRDIFALPVDEDFILSDHPTLNHFTAYIVKMQGGVPELEQEVQVVIEEPEEEPIATEIVEQPSTPTPTRQVSTEGCRRWQVEVEECSGESSKLELEGTIIVTDDGWGIAEEFCILMEERGLNAIRIGFESDIRDMSEQKEGKRTVYRADPGNIEHIEQVCEQLSNENISGVVHMAALKLAGVEWEEDTTPSSQIILSAQGWFALLKGLDDKLAKLDSGLIASVTALDGRHGNIGEHFNSVQCASSGVTKSYSFEKPSLRCRALDLHPDIVLDSTEAAKIIEQDLFNLGGEVEIGIDRDSRRWTLVAFAEDIESELKPLTKKDTWIVSGGGSGVTAASIIGVAKASENAKAHFLLLGRSTLIEETEAWIDWDDEQLNQQKMSLREDLIKSSEDGKVTMVEWNSQWQKFTRSRDVYITLDTINNTGNKAFYHSIDVLDQESLVELGSSLKRKITGVVHGAGLEDSKLVSDKSHSIFDRVVRVKVDGWNALMACVRASGMDNPNFAACFTSVAGRFGNGGQTDYAAANSVLDAEMARMTASGECRAVAIGWTGWRDVGMATRGSIEAVFQAAGIETLSVEKGVEIFVHEALAGGKRRVLGCGSLGLMDRFDSFREAPLRLTADMSAIIADPSRFPFIHKVIDFETDKSLLTQTTLSMEEHLFLDDHAIDGVPYHPGVMALEMFAENALLLNPMTCVAGFEEVKFGLPIKLLKDEMKVRVSSVVEKKEGSLTWVRCRLVSDLMNSKGEVFGEREHHQAMVRLVEFSDDLRPFLQSEVDSIPQIGIPAPGDVQLMPSFIYQRYFHGPRFQSHGGILRGVGDLDLPGADGIALMRNQLPITEQFSIESQGEKVLLDALPMLIEAGFQNAGFVAMESEGFSSLPVGIEWTSMLRVPERNEVLRMRSLRTSVESDGITVHDVIIIGDDDGPVMALKGLRLKSMAPVPEGQKFTLKR